MKYILKPPKKPVSAAVPAKKGKVSTAPAANPLFAARPKSFRVGGDIRVSIFQFLCTV